MFFLSLLWGLAFLYLLPKRSIIPSCIWVGTIFLFGTASIIFFVSNYFTWNGFDYSVAYHLLYGIEGTGIEGDKEMIHQFIGIALFTVLIAIIYFFWSLKTSLLKTYNVTFTIISLFILILFHPLAENIYELYFKPISITASHTIDKESLEWETETYKKYSFLNTDFQSNYISVPEVKISQKPKNLVYIYLESYEQLYLDETLFPKLSTNINALKTEAQVFTSIHQVFGTNWTIAWMVGSQCWIPLVGSLEHTEGKFLSKAYCMSDILKNIWYSLIYIGWADLKFAQKWNFYETHSFDTILWKQELKNEIHSPESLHDWGYDDDIILEKVFEKYERLSKQETPFALFTINLDTHWDEGILSQACKDIEYAENYNSEWKYSILNSYKCTDRLVWELVQKIQNSPYAENTIIVLSSDHYAMNHNNSVELLQEREAERRNLFMILDSTIPPHTYTRTGTILDIAPTVLTSLWIETQAFWLWRNLFNDHIQNLWESFTDTYSILNSWRSGMKEFW